MKMDSGHGQMDQHGTMRIGEQETLKIQKLFGNMQSYMIQLVCGTMRTTLLGIVMATFVRERYKVSTTPPLNSS